jgi:eukaryotic-like serine/threonine-protein kinase
VSAVSDSPELERQITSAGGATLLTLRGVIGSGLTADALIGSVTPPVLLDVDGVRRITSFGVREWVRAIAPFTRGQIYLAKCRPSIVAQLNAVAGFAGQAEVVSMYLPYLCEECGEEQELLVDLRTERDVVTSDEPPHKPCVKCGKPASFDDVPESYFAWVASQPPPEVPPAIKALLDGTSEAKQRLKVQKEVGDDVTALWLSGPVNERARFKRTVDGVEGNLLIVCGGITEVTDRGAEQIAQLVNLPGVNAWLHRVRPDIVRQLKAAGVDVFRKIISLVIPGRCETCDGKVVVISTDVLDGKTPATCAACGAPARTGLAAPKLATLTPLLQRPPAAVTRYVADHPGSFLAGLEDGEASTRVPKLPSSESGTPMSRYKVIGRIGIGGMAEVLMAEQKGPAGFHKTVVLKRILPSFAERADFVEMFLNEARIAAQVNHPNVVQIFDLGQDGPHYFIAMEYVRGIDLRGVLSTARRLGVRVPYPLAARIAADMCAGLHAAHCAKDHEGRPVGIVHRDVSPTNVLISSDGVVKVLDFGISKTLESKDETAPGMLKGKVIYMAPEQVDSSMGRVDGRADVFAAGLVLHQMLTGTSVFLRPTEAESIAAVLKAPIPRVTETRPDAPEELAQVVAKATARQREQRFQTAEDMRLALESFLSASGKPTTSTHLARWVEWLRGVGENDTVGAPIDVVDLADISSADTRFINEETVPEVPDQSPSGKQRKAPS